MSIASRRASRGARRAVVCASWALVCSCAATSEVEETAQASSIPLAPVEMDHGTGSPVEIRIMSPSGTYEMVEPDVVRIPGGWHGFEYWMAVNPYPGGSDYYENASVYASHDGLNWLTPDSLRNPVMPPPGGEIRHNSDPDLVFLPDPGRLVLFDRSVTASRNLLRQVYSDDGSHWSAPVNVFDTPYHELVSPTVTLVPGHRARLFAVNSGRYGCDSRSNTVTVRRWMQRQRGPSALIGPGWSAPVSASLQAPAGHVIWHLDVVWLEDRKEYWALFPAYGATESCAFNDLYVARSRDGLNWTTLETPIISRGAAPFVEKSIYRSSLAWDAPSQSFQVWFSGLGGDGTWHLGYQEFPVTLLSAALDAAVRK